MGEAGFTTFLVDDDPAVLRSITRLLKAAGYKTNRTLLRKNSSHRTIPQFPVVRLSTWSCLKLMA
jgi:FixJ family two-component response regulator